jgi:adenylate cyclase
MISRYSIAVLPFTDTSPGKDHMFLSDGFTVELIHALSRYPFLHVTSRYSSSKFSADRKDIREIRHKLQVAWLVDGHISSSEDLVTVTAQLIRTDRGSLAGSFQESGALGSLSGMQEKMASAVALQIKSSPDPVPRSKQRRPALPEAMEEYMKGQYFLNQLDSSRWEVMVQHFEKSLSLDPAYDRPMVALCHSYTWLSSIGMVDPAKARKEIDRLVNVLVTQNHQISDVYQLVAEKQFWIEWKPMQALDSISTALELNPSNSSALVMKGLIMASLGRIDESLNILFQAERLDPYGENAKFCIGLIYRYTGDLEKAYAYISESLEISPNWLAPYFSMMEVLCIQHRFAEVEEFIDQSRTVPGFTEMIPLFRVLTAAYDGRKEEAIDMTVNLINASQNESVSSPLYYYAGLICLQLHMKEEAMRWIDKGLRNRATPFLFIHMDSTWDPLRTEPRFLELKQQSGLPDQAGILPPPAPKYQKSRLSPDLVQKMRLSLREVLEKKMAFLDPKLSLADMAEMCDVSVNQLSQYINGNLGKNFYDYINRYRLDHFLKIAGKGEFQNLSILGLAYESGFNSKTTFNTFFHKEMKMTPREYLKGTNPSIADK